MKRGFLLGKFMPPHAGHVFMCRAAAALCDELTILVCSLDADPVPGDLRFAWMQEMFPAARVLHYTDDIPQAPEDHADFWTIWRDVIEALHPEPITHVFGSDPYVHQLAAELDATCVVLDPDREAMPVSGTDIRAAPFKHWDLLPDVVKPFYVKRICVFGPESTGKTTLAKDLATAFETVYMPEYGRIYDEQYRPGDWNPAHLVTIAETHMAMRRALERSASRLLIEDTDALLTTVWSEALAGSVDPWFEQEFELADLYLLTDIDVPWIDDGLRLFGTNEKRQAFFDKAKAALDVRGANYITVSGSWDERLDIAVRAVEALLKAGM